MSSEYSTANSTWFVHKFPVSQFMQNLTAWSTTPTGVARFTTPTRGARFTLGQTPYTKFTQMWSLYTCALFPPSQPGGRGSLHESERLVRHLLHRYNPALIPQEGSGGAAGRDPGNVTVAFVVMLHDVLGLEVETGRLHAHLHVQMVRAHLFCMNFLDSDRVQFTHQHITLARLFHSVQQ